MYNIISFGYTFIIRFIKVLSIVNFFQNYDFGAFIRVTLSHLTDYFRIE